MRGAEQNKPEAFISYLPLKQNTVLYMGWKLFEKSISDLFQLIVFPEISKANSETDIEVEVKVNISTQ